MSIRARRNSLLKSSISIGGIRDSVTKFTEGLFKSSKTAGEIVQKTNDNNNFKRKLIGKDNEFFRKRRENVRRKDREDELEAASVQGIAKRTGSLTASSTRGFLGRILDFFGIVLIGWFVTRLPKIIDGIKALINRVQKLITLLTGFIGSISNFLIDFGTGVGNAIMSIVKFDFQAADQQVREDLDKSIDNTNQINRKLFQAFSLFQNPFNFGMNRFDEGLIIKDNSGGSEEPSTQEDQPKGDGANTETEEATKPQGFMRGLTGAIDFATFGLTDLDKRGDLFGNKEEEQKNMVADPNQFSDVGTREMSEENLIPTEEKTELEKIEAQTKGETVEKLNQETEDENKEKKDDANLLTKINGFMSNMFGTKTKRETEKNNQSEESSTVEETVSKFSDISKDLETNMAEFAEAFKKDGKDVEITPMAREKLNLGKRKNSTTIYIVEKPVSVGSDGSIGGVGGGSGKSLNIPTENNNKDIMKKVQKVILQR